MPREERSRTPDPLSDVLNVLQLRGDVYARTEAAGAWGIAFPPGPPRFHVVERGDVWVTVEGQGGPVKAQAGDVLIIPHGAPHTLADRSDRRTVPLLELIKARSSGPEFVFRVGRGAPHTFLFCGRFHLEPVGMETFFAALPPLLHLRGHRGRPPEALDQVLRLFTAEVLNDAPGSVILECAPGRSDPRSRDPRVARGREARYRRLARRHARPPGRSSSRKAACFPIAALDGPSTGELGRTLTIPVRVAVRRAGGRTAAQVSDALANAPRDQSAPGRRWSSSGRRGRGLRVRGRVQPDVQEVHGKAAGEVPSPRRRRGTGVTLTPVARRPSSRASASTVRGLGSSRAGHRPSAPYAGGALEVAAAARHEGGTGPAANSKNVTP